MNLTYNDHLTLLDFLAARWGWVLGSSVFLAALLAALALADPLGDRPRRWRNALLVFVPAGLIIAASSSLLGWQIQRGELNQDRLVEQVHTVYGADVGDLDGGVSDRSSIFVAQPGGPATYCTVTPVKSPTRTHILECHGVEPVHR